ncbi:SURF1 family protein [Kordiimonas sp. SCSIO 12603]|uniref:SURF1 family protein n=1 Tax=Kordiimonas sp. SCSIO 12603 TaxID=2829596 RepID=UPI002107180E|nr:SURF1 family protein [Kordiimonas sp. SCSIO 12603]UTW58185.1 SURF1 family protein [Kordiimonas sp. SCSIO 12603]
MAERKRFQPGTGLTIATVISLIILSSLGTWQARKVGPKTAMLAQIEEGLTAEPIKLPVHVDDPAQLNYRKVYFSGTHGSSEPLKLFGTNVDGKPGYYLYSPVKTTFGMAVLVNWGWIPMTEDILPELPVGDVSITGVLRTSAEASSFTPANDPIGNAWYVANVHEMADAFGLRTKEYYHFRVFSDQVGAKGGLPLGGQVRVDIPNNHLQYTITWFGLAATLLAIYILFGLKRGRGNS